MPSLLKVRTTRMTIDVASQPGGGSEADAVARRIAAAVARGEEPAFQEFYGRYHQRLFRLALVLSRGDETAAQDAVQAAFITAAKKLRRAESEAHLWNWLARVARQHLAKAWRQQHRQSAVIGMTEVPDCAADAHTDSLLEETLEVALQALDDGDREIVEWFYFDRLSHKEMADRLSTTPKSVSSRLERARLKLRTTITRNLARET